MSTCPVEACVRSQIALHSPLCRIGLQPVDEQWRNVTEADGRLEAYFAEDEDDRLKTYPTHAAVPSRNFLSPLALRRSL